MNVHFGSSASELGESGSGMRTGGSLLNFFLQVSQIFEPIEICGALSHIHAVTGLRFFVRLLQLWPGISKGLQQD